MVADASYTDVSCRLRWIRYGRQSSQDEQKGGHHSRATKKDWSAANGVDNEPCEQKGDKANHIVDDCEEESLTPEALLLIEDNRIL